MSFINPIYSGKVDELKVRIYENRQAMGAAAGEDIAAKMKELLASKPSIRMIFAAAPSQNEALEALLQAEGIDWSRVTAFHMDEYIGLPGDAPQRFSQFLKDRLFGKASFAEVNLIDSSASIEEECERYAAKLTQAPIDIVCLGIGENGHIAFNDPPVADFRDPLLMKPVELDMDCRVQQVNDGCFPEVDAVPTHALTLTIPALMGGAHLFCVVPGKTKHDAVRRTLHDAISEQCPATILRTHGDCTLYADIDSYGKV
ncbi:glucosamine-6-phosphate deaminase [Paenibacillus sp. HB172176]|uniref:glucosamine-6-phosphate deaminase n=1 Tax=Paenibacillus sp. HB172176 TaxID=2493690 RepID=UPI00143AA7E2|nr:glucosamine-6-phosphate deaminase [Paenibacillus sp. HB172176]